MLSTSGGQLADNVENLRLMGGQALSAWGNDLANRMVGNDRANALVGQSGADRLFGEGGNDRLIGGGGGDFLKGGAGRDVLIGGAWKDRMRGDEGADRFEFRDVSDSVAGRGDIIADFEPGVDVIDLSAIDARTGPGNQAFRFIGDRAFDERPGQLRVDDGMISGDVDGDGVADFEIMVTSAVQPGEADFLL